MTPRIVSLIASSTEIVCALGLESALVGRSHECDYPEGVRKLPVCTAPKIDVEAPSARIDASVKELLKKAASIYEIDAARMKALRPDVVLTQTQCEVCAVSLKDVERAISKDWGVQPVVVALEPNALADVWEDIRRVARTLEAEPAGEALIRKLSARMQAVDERAKGLKRPRVACVEWIEPLMSAGNWMPELVEKAGGTNLFGEAGKHSPWMSYDELEREDPDIVVALPCGFDLARTRKEMRALSSRPGWKELSAVRAGRVYVADGNQYFNRPGPRLAESLEALAEMLHPKEFQFGLHGKAWERYDVEGIREA